MTIRFYRTRLGMFLRKRPKFTPEIVGKEMVRLFCEKYGVEKSVAGGFDLEKAVAEAVKKELGGFL